MTSRVSRIFTQADLDKVSQAVREAERKTSGEIVPYVVEQSDTYEDAEWRAGFAFGFVALAGSLLLRSFAHTWAPLDFTAVSLLTLCALAAGILLVKFVAPLKRMFAGHGLINRRVGQRAAEAFIAEEVFDTEGRTGILLFISLLERKVLVIGDSGINSHVKQEDWHDVVQRIVAGIRAGKPADGMIEAIGQCGTLLQKHGLPRRPDDRDELPDSVRLRDR